MPGIARAYFTVSPVAKITLHGVASGMTESTRVTAIWMRNGRVADRQLNYRWGAPANGRFDWVEPARGFRGGSYLMRFLINGRVVGSFEFQLAVENIGPLP